MEAQIHRMNEAGAGRSLHCKSFGTAFSPVYKAMRHRKWVQNYFSGGIQNKKVDFSWYGTGTYKSQFWDKIKTPSHPISLIAGLKSKS